MQVQTYGAITCPSTWRFSSATPTVNAAGPLKTPGGQGAGGIWIVDANDAGEVDQLVKQDPFWPTGLRKSVRILAWNQVYAEGRRRDVV